MLKIRFHVVLGKSEEEVWLLVNIVKVLSIVPDVLFEGLMQNFQYSVIQANNVAFKFTTPDFPWMNLSDLITTMNILSQVDKSQISGEYQETFFLEYAHIKAFIDCYYDYRVVTYVDLAMAIKK